VDQAKKTPLAEDGLDERTKHHARKEKKRLQEQKRRQVSVPSEEATA